MKINFQGIVFCILKFSRPVAAIFLFRIYSKQLRVLYLNLWNQFILDWGQGTDLTSVNGILFLAVPTSRGAKPWKLEGFVVVYKRMRAIERQEWRKETQHRQLVHKHLAPTSSAISCFLNNLLDRLPVSFFLPIDHYCQDSKTPTSCVSIFFNQLSATFSSFLCQK